eukprot:gnl/Dysnectes_brevis/6231_a9519_333.p1 GENE.gnl/Dysnectes_brevis/6231_a9519_333~~gnl/Dysnectes_brevis/6231_a9519_333.p1  ORF type:complete len:302 (+),score=74.19 gnl/Dysnectes_brevis/6231_a9519_333:567-1472(+)
MPVGPPSLLECFKGHSSPVKALAFQHESKQIASGGDDKCVMVWNLTPPIRAFRFLGHTDTVSALSYSPVQSLLASASLDRTLRLWTPNVHGESVFRKAHVGRIRDIAFSSDGNNMISAADDKTIKIWDPSTIRFRCTLAGHTNWVRSARFSPDGRMVASVSDDLTLRLWDTRTQQEVGCIGQQQGFTQDPTLVRWSPDGTSLLAGGAELQLWDCRSQAVLQHYSCHTDRILDASFHPSGRAVATASADGCAKVLDLEQGRAVYTVRGHEGSVNAVEFCSDGSVFATGGADGRVMMFEFGFE